VVRARGQGIGAACGGERVVVEAVLVEEDAVVVRDDLHLRLDGRHERVEVATGRRQLVVRERKFSRGR